ncbi:Class I SAM-dependent methyltransferase [Sulfidibacter corallicola]|uniref:Class I SAM-dependent methyltransferase n=1 Tax=Sulfidibacter corallicola TaxID=2818388 RepID=A0A8A4TVU0_SULCO|nr:class I SAM-dependent methyltransferase [Sulfidibacter corallicola]QTD50645.1 class I SAM-dependent methyltransferase [Sulfidibacter corallicola]
MENQKSSIIFDEERASNYEKRFAKMAPIREALDFLIRMVLSDLPADARILVIGAGTGLELLELARANPGWHFTAVEPAVPMLTICRKRAEELGVASRCTFHEGFLDTLPETEAFDAATCVLVSHFMMDVAERRGLFRQIAARLRPGGRLVNGDLASDKADPTYQSLWASWARALKHCEMNEEEVETYRVNLDRAVAVLPPEEVAAIIASAGFDAPVRFYQAGLIYAWFANLA